MSLATAVMTMGYMDEKVIKDPNKESREQTIERRKQIESSFYASHITRDAKSQENKFKRIAERKARQTKRRSDKKNREQQQKDRKTWKSMKKNRNDNTNGK